MIEHSVLTKELLRLGNSQLANDLIRLTRNGVAPEGGETPATARGWLWDREAGTVTPKNVTESPTLSTVGTITESMPKPELSASSTHDWTIQNAADKPPKIDNCFRFGPKSRAELVGVHPQLVKLAHLALRLSTQDFMIFDGLRTEEEQRGLVRKGASRTMKSYHLKQKDGYSHAIDCVPVVGATPKWDWNLIYPVVKAVDEAATELGIADRIVWGGAWDRRLSDFGGDIHAYQHECEAYAMRHPGKDFLDGPHFQWMD